MNTMQGMIIAFTLLALAGVGFIWILKTLFDKLRQAHLFYGLPVTKIDKDIFKEKGFRKLLDKADRMSLESKLVLLRSVLGDCNVHLTFTGQGVRLIKVDNVILSEDLPDNNTIAG